MPLFPQQQALKKLFIKAFKNVPLASGVPRGAAVGGAGPEAGHGSGGSTRSNAAVPAWVRSSVRVVPQQPAVRGVEFSVVIFRAAGGFRTSLQKLTLKILGLQSVFWR